MQPLDSKNMLLLLLSYRNVILLPLYFKSLIGNSENKLFVKLLYKSLKTIKQKGGTFVI